MQRAQDLGVRGKKHDRFVVQDLVVRLQCPQELVEFRILPERRGVGARSFRVGFRLDARGRARGFGLDADPFVVGLGGDLPGLQFARRAVLLGNLGAFGRHAVEDMRPVRSGSDRPRMSRLITSMP